jgi:hypothetical protein
MKIAVLFLVTVCLVFVVIDIIVRTIDVFTFLVTASCIALTVWLIRAENREQQQ